MKRNPSLQLEHFDPRERAAEKAASRAQDERALRSGEKSAGQLRRENDAFANMKISLNLEYAKLIR